MRRRLYLRACLMSVFYASLIFVPMHQPGMLMAVLLQLLACACLLAFLTFVSAYRNEICEFIQAAFQEYANLLVALPLAAEPMWSSQSDATCPIAPYFTPLSQRPPPLLA
jgi:hypothetical protein